MPLSTIYNVITRYRVDDSGAERKVSRVASAFGRLWDQAKWIVGGGLALGAGLGIKKMTELGVQAEKAKISIAGTFQVLSDEAGSFNQQLERADDLFQRFSKRSIESPASRKEFRQLFQGVAPAVGGLDIGNEQLAQFAQRSVGAAVAFTGQDFQQAGRDLRRILKGRAGAQVKTFQALKKPLLKSMGVQNVEEFNKLAEANPGETFRALNRVLKKTDPMLEEFKNSTAGLFATAKELVNRGLLKAWAGFGDAIRDELDSFIGWFQTNKGIIKETARVMGDRLGDALQGLVDLGQSAWRNLDKVKEVLGSIAVMEVGRLLGGKRLAGGLAATLEGALTTQISGMSLFGGGGIFGSLFAGVGAATGALLSIAVAGKAVADAVNIVRTETSKLNKEGRKAAAQSKSLFGDAWASFKQAFVRLGDVLGLVSSKTGKVADFGSALLWLGSAVLTVGEILVQSLNLIVTTVKWAVGTILAIAENIANRVPGVDVGTNMQDLVSDAESEFQRIFRDINTVWVEKPKKQQRKNEIWSAKMRDRYESQFLGQPSGPSDLQFGVGKFVGGLAGKTKKDKNQAAGDTNIDVTVNQEITTEADPDRIAFAVEEGVSKAVSGAKPKTATAKPFGK